jgi:voltage-gated potassium channel Kch
MSNRLDRETEQDHGVPRSPRKVIVAGFGPVGRAIAHKFEDAGVSVVVIETNQTTIVRQRELARQMVHGDVTDRQVLLKAGVRDADALILTIPNEQAAVRACILARELSPDIYIAARTNYLSQGLLATQAGADEVIVEEVVTAAAMERAVLNHLIKGERRSKRRVPDANGA